MGIRGMVALMIVGGASAMRERLIEEAWLMLNSTSHQLRADVCMMELGSEMSR